MSAVMQMALLASGPAGNDGFTKSLLHFDGTTTTIVDSNAGGSARTWTCNGNATQSATQSKFGGKSLALDGTGDYLLGDGSSDLAFGTGDFTIDFWFYATATGTTLLYDGRSGGNGPQGTIYFNIGAITYIANTAAVAINGSSPSTATWHHVAVVRSAGTTTLYLNGTSTGTPASDSTNYTNPASRPVLGVDGIGLGNGFNGYIDEFRVSKGIARWTANFTPPTAPYG